ncbi:MAG: hypothetical protein SNJ56_00415, partial [Termitinemataceae bacterium]
MGIQQLNILFLISSQDRFPVNSKEHTYIVTDTIRDTLRILHEQSIDVVFIHQDFDVSPILTQYPFSPCIVLGTRDRATYLQKLLDQGVLDYLFIDEPHWLDEFDAYLNRLWRIRNSL